MNILIDEVPKHIKIDDKEYKINTDFRISIMFELLMQDKTLTTREKSLIALDLYYPEPPHDLPRAIEKISWFYSCGKVYDEANVTDEKDDTKNKSSPIYSFEYDDELIFAAFLSQYGINLQRITHLHWWEFKSLFKGLETSSKIVEIMNIRGMKIDKNMSKEQKKHYRGLKELYKIPDNRTAEEKIRETQQAFNLFNA